MTYTETISLLADASECPTFDDFLAECGGAYPSDNVSAVTNGMKIIYSMRDAVTVPAILEAFDLTVADLSRTYSIPYRTVQNWSTTGSEHREAPPYVLKFILADLLGEL